MKHTLLILLTVGTLVSASTWMVQRAIQHSSLNLTAANQLKLNQGISATSQRSSLPATQSPTPQTPWAAIESDGLAEFIQNLRAVGCPEKTVQDIVVFRRYRECQDQVVEQRRQIVRSLGFHRQGKKCDWDAYHKQNYQAEASRGDELEALLGVNATALEARVFGRPDVWDHEDYLPANQRKRLAEINGRYQRWKNETSLGVNTPAVAARLAALDHKQKAEIKSVLTAQEFSEYIKHQSPAARYVLRYLPEALSEADYLKMVKLVDELGMAPPPPSSMAARYGFAPADDANSAAQARREANLETRIKEALGTQRWNQMLQADEARNTSNLTSSAAFSHDRIRTCFGLRADLMGIKRNDALQFYDQLMELKPALQAKYAALEQSLPGTPDEKKTQARAALRTELAQRASALNPDKGPALIYRELDSGNNFNDFVQ